MRLFVLVLLLVGIVTPSTTAAAGVGVVTIEGPIGPATAAYVARGLATAGAAGHRALVIEIDTPGGLMSSTREIVTAILAAPLPVIGHVAPEGAQAASAGAYILMATHLAAMAPATNVGAATPVQMGSPNPLPSPRPAPDDDGAADEADAPPPVDAARAKAVNDAAAYLVSLAELRGRDPAWAEEAVREASSLSAAAARERGVVELIAADRSDLVRKAHGRVVVLHGEREVRLDLTEAAVVEIAPNWQERLLAVLANPNVAYILMLLGVYGIIFELANPGIIGSGIIGAICLLLGLFALNLLPIDYAGVGLILLGVALMVGEALTPSLGILGLGGAAAFALGSILLIDTDVPGFTLSPWVIAAMTASSLGLVTAVLAMAVRARRVPVVSGVEALIGSTGRVVAWDRGRGTLHIAGETWRATGPERLAPGEEARVMRVDGLTLEVEPATQRQETV